MYRAHSKAGNRPSIIIFYVLS
ncbi:MAG: hypothetical protein Greene07144_1085, partial [Parcubacteria group bacterium Greene0714_4]